ncbi:MAG: magnesium transporter [Alphaproteobacteria bacterium]|jgi:magnesium transporter|nr:magnesium transporter [Alphaproteobacteria bacterium]
MNNLKEEKNIINEEDIVEKEENLLNDNVSSLLSQDKISEVVELISEIHSSDSVKVLENLSTEERYKILVSLPKSFYVEAIEWFSDYLIQELLDSRGIDFIVALIQENQDVDLTYFIVKDLDEKSKDQILDAVSSYKRKVTEKKFNYPKDSAGRLMQSSFVKVLDTWTVYQCINYIKEFEKNLPHGKDDYFYDIFIVDDKGVALGGVSLSKLITTDENTNIMEIKNDSFRTIHTHIDQEEVALIFRSKGFISAGVVDNNGVLVGIISLDNVLDVVYQESQEDLLLMAGIQAGSSKKYKTIFYASQKRLKWLSFNFISALTIPFIVTAFSDTLGKHVILAALIQFVVALGGNAGMQSLAITLRGITLKVINKSNIFKQIGKELGIAFLNGIILGSAGIVWGSFWGSYDNSIAIGIIAFLAVFINVILGATFGTLYPIILKRLHIDPAIASSVCITTSTDVVGYFLVLLVATLILT